LGGGEKVSILGYRGKKKNREYEERRIEKNVEEDRIKACSIRGFMRRHKERMGRKEEEG
jgi:hypothetical protein